VKCQGERGEGVRAGVKELGHRPSVGARFKNDLMSAHTAGAHNASFIVISFVTAAFPAGARPWESVSILSGLKTITAICFNTKCSIRDLRTATIRDTCSFFFSSLKKARTSVAGGKRRRDISWRDPITFASHPSYRGALKKMSLRERRGDPPRRDKRADAFEIRAQPAVSRHGEPIGTTFAPSLVCR